MYGSGVYDDYYDINYPIADDYTGYDSRKYSNGDAASVMGDIYKSNSQAVESYFLGENIRSGNTKNATPTYDRVLADPVKFAGNIINNMRVMREKFQADLACEQHKMYMLIIVVLVFVIIISYLQNRSLQKMLMKSMLQQPTK